MLSTVQLYSLADKSPVEPLPVYMKGEFCSGDISLLSLPRLFTMTIPPVQHNEKNSGHEVLLQTNVARSSAAVAELQSCRAAGLREKNGSFHVWGDSQFMDNTETQKIKRSL